MSTESSGIKEDRKEAIKKMIRDLHEGADPEKVKGRFRELIGAVTATDIAEIEEELIREGMPRDEIQRLCDIHLALFKESLEKEKVLAPRGHPIHILMEEHKMLLRISDELMSTAREIVAAQDFGSISQQMKQLVNTKHQLEESEKHYLREENVLFPYIEKHGVTQPPAIMWMEHGRIREIEKNIYAIIEAREKTRFKEFAGQLERVAYALADMLSSHFYKENNILFPTALRLIGEDEWKQIRRQFDEVGYCCFTPQSATLAFEKAETLILGPQVEGVIEFETGKLSKEEMEAVLNALPVDITFVDKEDTVRYFNQSKERIFTRTKAVIGRKVQQCHPQKSIHIVNQILQAFKSGKRDTAEFWIDVKGRLVHIRYLAVRDKNGAYLGCLEVTQDITNIKKIEGEKRLLDWT